jgi:AraC family L-rhamnose operon regulatory protein RhaS
MRFGFHSSSAVDIEHEISAPMRGAPLIYHTPNPDSGVDSCEPQRKAIEAGKIQFHAITHGHYPGSTLSPATIPGLSSLGYWDAIGEQDWGLEPHCNEGIEIVLIETGRNAFVINGASYRLRAGNVTVTRPWELHSLGDPNLGPGRLHWLILDVGVSRPNQKWKWPSWVVLTSSDLLELSRRLRTESRPVWKTTQEITRGFRALAECVREGASDRPVSRIMVQINLLLVALLDALRSQNAPDDGIPVSMSRQVESFFKDLIDHPQQLAEPWTLRSMADRCGMGSTAFVQYCRRVTNTSPLDFLNRCRLARAARLLDVAQVMSVTDIAFGCGYSSSQYFATQFRRRYGSSPSNYRHRG